MESYSSSSSSSVSCPFAVYQVEEGKKAKPLPSYQSSLHAVRRVPKPMTKKPIAPMPPTPPKIYKVEPLHFKETVQMLTTAPGFQSAVGSCSSSRRLQDVAPPPLDLKPKSAPESHDAAAAAAASDWQTFLSLSAGDDAHVSDVFGNINDQAVLSGETSTLEIIMPPPHPRTTPNVCGGYASPLGVPPLSPSSLAWWASILPSPGTLSSL
nr:serine/arginine repetitive matrix protein 2-like [Ipomoea batatas]